MAQVDHSELSDLILDRMADGVIVFDADGRVTYVSAQAEQITGYSRQELLDLHAETLVPARLRARHEENRRRYMSTPTSRGMGTELDIRLRRKDGRELPVDIALSPLQTETGPQVVAVIRDASARRQAERTLREQAQLLELAHDSILVRRASDNTITFWNQGAVETYRFSRGEAMGKPSHQLLKTVFPEDVSGIERALAEEGRWEGELVHTRKDGTRLVVSSRWVTLYDDDGRPGAVLEINSDITEEKRGRDRLAAVLEVNQAFMSGEDPDSVLSLIARRARELANAALATFAIPDDDSDWLSVRVAEGASADRLRGMRLPSGQSISGRTLATHRPTVVDDLMTDTEAFPEFVKAAAMGPALFVPLSVGSEDFGTLMVANPQGSPRFGPDDVAVMELFAAAAAVSIGYARAREAFDRMIVLEDRERIARELHDGAIQTLFGVGMSLQSTALLSREAHVAGRLEESVSTIDQVVRDLRNYIFGLRPGILRVSQLDQALRKLVEKVQSETGVAAVADLDPEAVNAIAEKAPDVLQLASEAISNVRRHAEAQTCRISLRLEDRTVLLEVDDDGKGFDQRRMRQGQGLRNFRERTQRLGGDVTVESSSGNGTTVRATIPI